MKYKFSINQKVKVSLYNRWIGDYEVPGTIIGLGNVFMNGMATYSVKTINGDILNEVIESDIVNDTI